MKNTMHLNYPYLTKDLKIQDKKQFTRDFKAAMKLRGWEVTFFDIGNTVIGIESPDCNGIGPKTQAMFSKANQQCQEVLASMNLK